jgi:hypothetical protein
MMARARWALGACVAFGLAASPAQASRDDPSFLSGIAQMIAGPTIELPAAFIEHTLERPLLLGPLAGLVIGTFRAIQRSGSGLIEFISVPFQPPAF